MATLVVTAAGLTVWSLLMIVVVQRQRVLRRRLARIERRVLRPRGAPDQHRGKPAAPAWGATLVLSPPKPARRTPPPIQQLAAVARRFGG